MFKHHPLFSLENIYRAYRQCRKHKRGTVNAMKFEQNLEENLVSLHEELTTGTYRPGRSIAFLIERDFTRSERIPSTGPWYCVPGTKCSGQASDPRPFQAGPIKRRIARSDASSKESKEELTC